jgi:hypothetical protein
MPPRMTPTARLKAALHLDGPAKSLMAEHLRAMIRMYGIGGIKDGAIEQLFYEILFLDPLTTRHFGRFQGMWEHRASAAQPYLEWWTQFRAFVRDCLDKTRVANNRYQLEKWTAYSANDGDFYDSPAFDWPTLATDTDARVRWFPQPRYRQPPAIPVHHARRAGADAPRGITLLALRIFLIDPMTAGVSPHRADDYPLWSPHTVEVTQSVLAYTLPAVFAAIVAVCPDGRRPRVIYGCRLNPRNPEDAEDDNGNIPAAIETQARLSGATYRLRPRDTVQLTSNATVSAWSAAAIGAAHNTPTVIAILGRVDERDTPPRDLDVHFNGNGIPMPVRRPPESESEEESDDADEGEEEDGDDEDDGEEDDGDDDGDAAAAV